MPDVNSIPFRQANGNGHYESKQLPNDNQDFLAILGLPVSLGNVTSVTVPSRDGQLVTYWQTGGLTIKGSTAIGLVDLVDGVVTTKPTPAGDIVGTTAIQTLRNKTIENSSIVSPSGLTKADVGLGNADNTADMAKPVSTATSTALVAKEDKANKNVANGYAGLDAGGKVVAAQLPAAVQGCVSYQGLWNAIANSPPIPTASAANKGWYYVVNVAGTTAIDGINSWGLTDWIVSNGSVWNKVDNTDSVTSVAGQTGVVVLTKADVGLANVDNTSDATKNAAPGVLTNKTIAGADNVLTVRLDTSDVIGNLPVSHFNGGAGASTGSFWRGDGQWAAPAGGGNVTGPVVSIDGEIVLFNGTSGTLIRRAGGTGLVTVVSGVFQPPTDPAVIAPPVGSIMDFAGSTAPTGWLLCFGQAVARVGTYATLWGVIGTTYGVGDGSSTFNLPDLRGRLVTGKDDMGGTLASRMTLTRTGNTTSGNVTIATMSGTPLTELAVGMSVVGAGISAGCVISTVGVNFVAVSPAPTATATGVSLRFGVVDGAVLGAAGGRMTHQIVGAEIPAHTHSYSTLSGAGSNSFTTGGNLFGAIQTSAYGGDTAHNNVQPTIVLNKIIKY
jgi:microcystin-dependent protein